MTLISQVLIVDAAVSNENDRVAYEVGSLPISTYTKMNENIVYEQGKKLLVSYVPFI